MDDTEPDENQVPRGPLLTLQEAAVLADRPSVRVLQRWVATGILPSRFRRPKYPFAQLVTYDDLMAVAKTRKTGKRKGHRLRTLDGQPYKPND